MRVTGERHQISMRYAALFLVTVVVLLVSLSLDPRQASSQSTGRPAYAQDHIFVKFKEDVSQESIARVKDTTNTSTEDEFSFIDVEVVGLPEGLSVSEAVKRYESSRYVEYAEPDPIAYPDQTSAETDSYEAGPGDVIEAAPDEAAPTDPAPDPVIQVAASEMDPKLPDDPMFPNLWGLDNREQAIDPDPGDAVPGNAGTFNADIDAPEAWSVTTGGPEAVVAVIDSGVDVDHPDLSSNVWVNEDEIPGNGADDDLNGYVDDTEGWDFAHSDNAVYDEEGEFYHHGTHLAGTIAASGNNGVGVAGVNWEAKIMPLKFMAPGGGTGQQAIEALKYAVNNGAKISNHSYRFGSYNQTFKEAIDWANSRGHLVVASAGNSATDADLYPQYPAGYDSPNVISVAATDSNDSLWPGSNRGTNSVDLAAPGVDVVSTLPGNAYGYKTGTSMAATYVSGVASLLKSQQPGLTPQQLKDHILLSTDKKVSLTGTSVTGGRLNAAEALGIKSTQISVGATPQTLAYGAGTTVSGKLTSSGQALAGKQVVLEKRTVGENRFTPFANVTTASNGTFSNSGSHPVKHTDYRARFGGERDTTLGSSVSASARVNVRVNVTLSVAQTNLLLGRARAMSGHVGPSHAGKYVTLTIDKRNSTWILRRNLRLDANSRYYTTFKPGSVGYYDITVRYAGDSDHLANTSIRRTFRVVN